jgi:hypothetical protein
MERLILSFEQILILEGPILKKFAEELAKELRERNLLAVRDLSQQELIDRNFQGLLAGRRHKLDNRGALKVFVTLRFQIHPKFDQHPEIIEILNQTSFSQERRMREILDWIAQGNWQKLGGDFLKGSGS